MKHATNSEVLLFKRLIENKLATLLTSSNSALSSDLFNGSGLSEEEVVDFEFISNPQAIQTSVKNTFGYVRSRNSSGTNSVGSAHGSLRQQPPISRPTSSNRYVIVYCHRTVYIWGYVLFTKMHFSETKPIRGLRGSVKAIVYVVRS